MKFHHLASVCRPNTPIGNVEEKAALVLEHLNGLREDVADDVGCVIISVKRVNAVAVAVNIL